MRLIGVIWDDDRGVVDLETFSIVMYVAGDFDIENYYIPTVEIKDEDFHLLMALDEDDEPLALYDVANWENVPALLALESFKLWEKLTHPDEEATQQQKGE